MTTKTKPTNGNGLTTPHSQPAKLNTKTSLILGSIQGADDSKAIANQIARLALAGHYVIKGDRGDFTVCKYGLTRYCANLAELATFARQIGALK